MLESKLAQPGAALKAARRKILPAQAARPLQAFHHLLAGPPLSERERFMAKVDEARIRRYQGPWELYRNSRTRHR